jgi:hypothetical protein
MKLLNIAKNIMAKSPDIPAIIRMVPRISISLFLGSSLSRCSSRGKCEHEEVDDDEECDHEDDTDRPGHAELPDDNTREYRYHGEGEPIHCSDLPIGPVSFSLGDEYGHESRECYHADIAHEILPSIDTRINTQSQGFHISLQVDCWEYEEHREG